jgi:hypothetical protein
MWWIAYLIFQYFHQVVKEYSQKSSNERTNPVNPVIARKLVCNRVRTEAPSRVQGTSSIIYSHELSDEQRESDSYRSDVCSPMFLFRQHDDREHQLRCAESFDENSLRQCCSSSKCCPNIKRTREYDFDDVCSEAAAADLRDQKEEGSKRMDVSCESKCQCDLLTVRYHSSQVGTTYSRIKQSTTNTEEYPCVDHEAESKRQGNIQQCCRIKSCCCSRCTIICSLPSPDIGYLGPTESKEKEERRPDKFSNHRNGICNPVSNLP